MHLERFTEALADPSSDLTYPALTGARKQSVVDAERLFNPNLSAFMKQKGYTYEATYIECICNWRKACDERGLKELTRCKYNYQFLNLVLNELMPWFSETYDFSLLEVNRYMHALLYMCYLIMTFMLFLGQLTVSLDSQERLLLQ